MFNILASVSLTAMVVPLMLAKGVVISVQEVFQPEAPNQQQLENEKYTKLAIITRGQCASPNGIGGCRYDSLQTVPTVMPTLR
jgi:hypothetical protein